MTLFMKFFVMTTAEFKRDAERILLSCEKTVDR